MTTGADATTPNAADPRPPAARAAVEGPRYGRWLALWVALVVALQAAAWLSGLRGSALAAAVEQGAGAVETRGLGEVADEAILEAIRLQHDTLPFWAALAALADFVFEPAALVARSLMVAILFGAAAALSGRKVQFEPTLDACARAQGYWVLGLAVRVGLMLYLGRATVETGATLLLPPGSYPAALWVGLEQLDAFALLGWIALALAGWRRGQASLLTASLIVGLLAVVEAALRIACTLVVGAGMRSTLLPA